MSEISEVVRPLPALPRSISEAAWSALTALARVLETAGRIDDPNLTLTTRRMLQVNLERELRAAVQKADAFIVKV